MTVEEVRAFCYLPSTGWVCGHGVMDRHEQVRKAGSRAIPALLTILCRSDVDPPVVSGALDAVDLLRHVGHRPRREVLLPLVRRWLHHPDPMVSYQAVRCIRDIGDADDLPALVCLLDQKSLSVQIAAYAIAEFGGEAELQVLADWLAIPRDGDWTRLTRSVEVSLQSLATRLTADKVRAVVVGLSARSPW